MLIVTNSSHYSYRASFYCTVIHNRFLHDSKHFIFKFGNFFHSLYCVSVLSLSGTAVQ